jgi:hypothetical protein
MSFQQYGSRRFCNYQNQLLCYFSNSYIQMKAFKINAFMKKINFSNPFSLNQVAVLIRNLQSFFSGSCFAASSFFTAFSMKAVFLSVLLVLGSVSTDWAQTSTQNFGTGTGSNTSQTAVTNLFPNPTSGTTYARAGANAPAAPIVLANTSNPLGTTGSFIRAVASSSTSVSKFSPWVGYTGGAEFYTSFKVLFGDASGGSTATSGVWKFYQGAGAMYSDATDFAGAQVFTGLTFTYGAGGSLSLTYRAAATNSTTGLTTSTFSSGTVYTIEIVGNNKTSGTINYTYGGAAQTVAVQKFDLFVNGTLIGNDLAEAQLPANTAINAGTFIGISSGSNVANVFVDDAITYNAVPSAITGISTISSTGTLAAINTTYGTASAAQTFTVGGTGLTANLVATAPTGFEVSSDGTTYGTTATFTQSSGTASGSLRIRLSATATVAGSYNSQNIVLSSTGATSVNITTTASGNSVTPKALTITGITANNKIYNGTTAATLSCDYYY